MKKEILKELKRRVEEKSVKKEVITNLTQELEKCNDIQMHNIKLQTNNMGRRITALTFSFTGFMLWLALFSGRGFYKIYFLPLFVIIPGRKISDWKFRNSEEYKKFMDVYNKSLTIDEEFYAITNNLNTQKLNH